MERKVRRIQSMRETAQLTVTKDEKQSGQQNKQQNPTLWGRTGNEEW
jgi:hypothetical protein